MTAGLRKLSYVIARTSRCAITTLWCLTNALHPAFGVSVFSAPPCVSTVAAKQRATSLPRPESSTRILSPSFLAEGWDLDVMSQEGFEKMKEIVTDVFTQTEKGV